ncbi:hypothetical protein ACFPA8_10535 [Streptomyces ovatisporus]|uniref:Uncharacterized protein n=1 Tax=Streptomyces ovatisporus TaxID=1128682 RepID=A0ABV9A7K7_9ACTN
MDENDPRCSLCGRRYDATFMTGLPCRVFSPDDVVTDGCPPQRKMMAELDAERRRGSAPPSGGCLVVMVGLLLFLITMIH